MNASKAKKNGPFAPIEALLNWFDAQTLSHQVRLAIHVVEAVPSACEVPYDDPRAHFRDWLEAPIQRDVELVARLGSVKAVFDVCLGVPIANNEVQAFSKANVALRLAKFKANGDSSNEEFWRLIQKNSPAFEDSDADFYISWRELCDGGGPLSDKSLYAWLFRESGRDSPLLD